MAKQKRKLTAAEKAAKKRRSEEFQTIFINGKQKRVRRPAMIDGMAMDEFIRQNADPISPIPRLLLATFPAYTSLARPVPWPPGTCCHSGDPRHAV